MTQPVLNSIEDFGSLIEQIGEDLVEHSFEEPLTEFAKELEESHANFFATSTAPNGQAWLPLAPATIARKGHDTILVETTAMRESLRLGAGDNVLDVGTTGGGHSYLSFGTSDWKAGFHQFGTSRIPARPFVGMTDEQPTQLAEIIADEAVESMK